nr:MAG TPA: hypothetical protein [Caudoviricetes sp.]
MFEKRFKNLNNKKIQSYKLGYKIRLQKNRVCNFPFKYPDFG